MVWVRWLWVILGILVENVERRLRVDGYKYCWVYLRCEGFYYWVLIGSVLKMWFDFGLEGERDVGYEVEVLGFIYYGSLSCECVKNKLSFWLYCRVIFFFFRINGYNFLVRKEKIFVCRCKLIFL